MKILGIGVDIVENKRIRFLINNKDFINRTFGKKELKLSKSLKNKVNYFAKRFSAKEAFVKSLGTGFRNNLNFKDIEILNDKLGKPYFKDSKKIQKIIQKKFKTNNYNLFFQFLMKKIIQ